MVIKRVLAVKVPPQEDGEGIHELGLTWYRFEDKIENSDMPFKESARPAVWIKFSQVEQLERIQGAYPEAKLGPASSFTEALIFAENWEKGDELQKKVTLLLQNTGEVDEMEAMLREDTMEDY